MTSLTTTIRLEPTLKQDSVAILERMGLTLSNAITIFLKQVVLTSSIPFELRAAYPSEVVRHRLDDINTGKETLSRKFSSTDELMKDLLDA